MELPKINAEPSINNRQTFDEYVWRNSIQVGSVKKNPRNYKRSESNQHFRKQNYNNQN